MPTVRTDRTRAAADREDPVNGKDRRRVVVVRGGPVLVEGPVEIEVEGGETVVSDRVMVAICACRRSRRYPFCDTSHRKRARPEQDGPGGEGTGPGQAP